MPTSRDLSRMAGDLGALMVAHELMWRRWDVLLHLGGVGYDLLALKGKRAVRVEVKTRDVMSGDDETRPRKAKPTASQRDTADFLVCVVLGRSAPHGHGELPPAFYIIPMAEMRQYGAVSLRMDKSGKMKAGWADCYLNKWDLLKTGPSAPAQDPSSAS